jgi:hypothetical protein
MGIKNCTKPSPSINLGIKVDNYDYQNIKYINIICNHDSQIYLNFVSSFMKPGNSLIFFQNTQNWEFLGIFFFGVKYPEPMT